MDSLSVAIPSQDKLLRLAARERKYFKSKYESTRRDLESARVSFMVSDETECDGCALHMSNITTLQTKYAAVIGEHEKLRTRSSILGVCTACPSLQIELAKRNI